MSEPNGEQAQVESESSGDESLGEGGLKALRAEREARKTAEDKAASLQAQLDEIEKANLSELERAQREAAEAKAALAEQTRAGLINKVALDKGVPADLAGLLSGDSEEEIAAKADVLLAHIKDPAPRAPIPDPTQGAKGAPGSDGVPNSTSTADAFAQLIGDRLS